MKAAVLRKTGQPLEVITGIMVPEPAPGQVLVKIAYSGVCHSQLMEVRGGRGNDPYLPHMLGHEGSGIVEKVGQGVTKVKVGQRVILGWIKGSGADIAGVQYSFENEKINAGGVTTFSEFTLASENRCMPLHPDVPLDVAVLFGCAVPTGAGIVTNTVNPTPGSTGVIFGLGGIGMSALMACKLYRCSQLIAVDVEPEKLNLAIGFGATAIIDSSKVDPVSEIMKMTGGRGADFAVESAGHAITIQQAFASVRRGGGRCVFASHPKTGTMISIDPYELICGKQLLGSWGGQTNPDKDIPKFVELYRQGKLPLEKLLTRRYRLEDINAALNDLENRKVGRPLIEINPDMK